MTLSAYVIDSGAIFSQNAPKNDTISYFGQVLRQHVFSDVQSGVTIPKNTKNLFEKIMDPNGSGKI